MSASMWSRYFSNARRPAALSRYSVRGVRPANVFQASWNDSEATAGVLVEGWLRTGDIATADDEGYLLQLFTDWRTEKLRIACSHAFIVWRELACNPLEPRANGSLEGGWRFIQRRVTRQDL